LAVVLRDPAPSAATVARLPLWAWSGGVFGAIFIGLSIITVPKLGGAAYIAILVTGQMIAALAVDHFGWLWLPERHIDLPRLLEQNFTPPATVDRASLAGLPRGSPSLPAMSPRNRYGSRGCGSPMNLITGRVGRFQSRLRRESSALLPCISRSLAKRQKANSNSPQC